MSTEMSTATTSGDGGQGIHALCDDTLMEILVLLPNKSVLCCRAVCRRWRRVTNDRSFLAGISARRSLKMITILSRSDIKAVTAVSLSAGDDDPASPARSHLFDQTQLCWDRRTSRDGLSFYVVCCSLDGLLVLHQRPGLYVICNPATRQWTNLPALPPDPCGLDTVARGFYSHGSSGEYRLLCHVGYKRRSYYYVLSTGAGAVPRRLRRDHPPSSWNWDYETRPVARRGILHWLASASHPVAATAAGKDKMLAFDTASETFRLMSRPPTRASALLLEIDGELSAAVVQGCFATSIAIWDLRDYEAEVWTLRCRVEVPAPAPLPRLFGFGRRGISSVRLHSVGGGAILIQNRYSSMFGDDEDCYRLYDLKETRMLGEISFSPEEKPTFLVFRESFVSHAFFSRSPRRSSEVACINFFSD